MSWNACDPKYTKDNKKSSDLSYVDICIACLRTLATTTPSNYQCVFCNIATTTKSKETKDKSKTAKAKKFRKVILKTC